MPFVVSTTATEAAAPQALGHCPWGLWAPGSSQPRSHPPLGVSHSPGICLRAYPLHTLGSVRPSGGSLLMCLACLFVCRFRLGRPPYPVPLKVLIHCTPALHLRANPLHKAGGTRLGLTGTAGSPVQAVHGWAEKLWSRDRRDTWVEQLPCGRTREKSSRAENAGCPPTASLCEFHWLGSKNSPLAVLPERLFCCV